MKVLGREDLRNQLRKKEIAPAYLLFGAETFLRDLAARTISDIVLRDAPLREFNESEFSLNSSDIRTALAAAEQLPMMGSRRVVRISDLVVSTNSQLCNLKEEAEGVLRSYLSNPSETSVVVFVADEIDKRLRMAKSLIQGCVSVEFERLEEPELMKFARERVRALKVGADEKALSQIVGLVGDDLRKLHIEIEKLAVAAHPDKVITFELVESLVPASREITNFELVDHLLGNQKTRALQVLKEILDDGVEPLMLLGLIGSNFHRLLLAKELMNEGVPRQEVVRSLRLPYRKQEAFLAIARRTEREKFAEILKRIAGTDLAIKTSLGTPRLQIEILVCELAGMH